MGINLLIPIIYKKKIDYKMKLFLLIKMPGVGPITFNLIKGLKIGYMDGTEYKTRNPLITVPIACSISGAIGGMVLGFVIGGAVPVYFIARGIRYLSKEFSKGQYRYK